MANHPLHPIQNSKAIQREVSNQQPNCLFNATVQQHLLAGEKTCSKYKFRPQDTRKQTPPPTINNKLDTKNRNKNSFLTKRISLLPRTQQAQALQQTFNTNDNPHIRDIFWPTPFESSCLHSSSMFAQHNSKSLVLPYPTRIALLNSRSKSINESLIYSLN